MSPSGLSWLQGFLGVLASVAVSYFFYWLQNRRTNRGTSSVELSSIRVENENDATPFDDAESSGRDEEARSPSNLSNPVGEAMAFTGSPSWPDRNRLRSKSRKRHPRKLLKPSAETRKMSHFLELEGETEVPNFATRETACNTIVADRTPSPMSSTTAGLLRPLGGVDEALSPSHPIGEALALPGTPSCPDCKRYRSNSCKTMNAPEERTKSMAKDEARNIGRPEPANMIVVDSSSTSMASTTAVLRRPLHRHFVPRPSQEIPLVDQLQTSAFYGLHRRRRPTREFEFFQRNYEEHYPGEVPYREMKVRIRPNQSNIPRQLTTELRNEHNMDLSQSNSNRHIVIVSGRSLDYGFGKREVMEVVRKYAPHTKVLRESSQRGGRRG